MEWLQSDGGPDREMRLLEDFAFRDDAGVLWEVPAGAVVDGASIPPAFWSVVGSPFVGDYRLASVVHDHHCKTKERSWKEVHRMFYDGVVSSGVPASQAKVFYAAVLAGGPRWERVIGAESGGPEFFSITPEFSEADYSDLREWINSDDPGLAAIESRVQEMVSE